MENVKMNVLGTENICCTDSVDIIQDITEFVSYLKNDDNCQTLLKMSQIELKNEIQFKQRAENILEHRHCQDLILSEEKFMNEIKQCFKFITSDMETEIGKENTKNISELYQDMLILKMYNVINDSKQREHLEEFIKINKINLKYMSKIKKEVKSLLYKLSSKHKSQKKSDKKIAHTTNISKDRASWISSSNLSRINTQDNNSQTQPMIYEERVRLECIANDYIIDSQSYVNKKFRMKFENDSRTMDNLFNRIHNDKAKRCRNYENIASLDSTISSADDDFVEYSCLNNTPNLSKDMEENNSGDVHLILNPFDT